MIKLKNIKKIDDNTIECSMFPEDSEQMGYMLLDISEEKMLKCELPRGYEWCTNHVAHAKRALLDMAKNNHIAKEKTVVWC